MRWSVKIPGQPWSGNTMYERNAGNAGQHKRPGVEAYQVEVTYRVREARPSGWRPDGQIVVEYYFELGRDIDCTNAIKVIEDGVATALRPEDKLYDRMFLPRAMAKSTKNADPFVLLVLEDL